MSTAKIKSVIRKTNVYLVEQLMSYKKCSRDEALELLMGTTVYDAIMDPETDMYLESRESVWDLLLAELNGKPEEILA